jgi:iron complex outermembrane receptor protein
MVLRGSYGTTFRGPPEDQLVADSVTSLQNIAGTFRAVDTFGNPALQPESAKTFNVGMILRAGAFSASLDYWNFDFDNPIVVEPVGGIVSALFPNGASTTLPNNCGNPAYAGVQSRFTFNAAGCAAGNISRLRVAVVNGAPVKTDGLDLSLQYDWDNVLSGTLTLGVNATYILKYDVDATVVEGITVAPAFDAVGFLNYQTTAIPLPQWKGNAFLEYSAGPHNLRWTTNYIDGYTDQRVLAVNPALGKEIGSFVTHDLAYRVELPWEMRVIAAAENIFNEDPPFVRLELAYDPFTASALGRTFKLGVSKRFGRD